MREAWWDEGEGHLGLRHGSRQSSEAFKGLRRSLGVWGIGHAGLEGQVSAGQLPSLSDAGWLPTEQEFTLPPSPLPSGFSLVSCLQQEPSSLPCFGYQPSNLP